MGSTPGSVIPKTLNMVPVATLLGAQHYKACTGFFEKYSITNSACLAEYEKVCQNEIEKGPIIMSVFTGGLCGRLSFVLNTLFS